MDDSARREDYRMAAIFKVIHIATQHKCHLWRGRLCPKLRELWLEMIEGSDPTDHDVWLWMVGDEQWLRKRFCRRLVECSFSGANHQGDWIDAQSALCRRIHRPHNNAGHPVERIRNATREQRLAAICWLTFNSSRVKALTVELGHTPCPHISVDLVGMDAFTNITADKNLTKEQLQLQLAMKFTLLVSIPVVIVISFIL